MGEQWGEGLSLHFFDPSDSRPLPLIRILVNGHDIAFLDGIATLLKEGDEVLMLPLVGGG